MKYVSEKENCIKNMAEIIIKMILKKQYMIFTEIIFIQIYFNFKRLLLVITQIHFNFKRSLKEILQP